MAAKFAKGGASDEPRPLAAPIRLGAGALRNGLYSIHVTLGDGRIGKGSGVIVLRDGVVRGGDSYLFYLGTYEDRGGTIYGEIVVDQHTPSPDATPLFGGRQVGIGFTGHPSGNRFVLDGTALFGRESLPFRASMMFLAEVDEPAT